jgi:hypothetical protein
MIEAEAVVERITGYLSSSQKVWIRQRAKIEDVGMVQCAPGRAGTCALLKLLSSVGQLAKGPGAVGR